MKKSLKFILPLFVIAIGVGTYFYFSNKEKEPMVINPEFANYISAFTSGIVSSESTIRIRLTEEYNGKIQPNEPIETDLFDFSPSISGEAYWIDNRTIEFRPSGKLPSGKLVNAEFALHKLVDGLKEELQVFQFQFQVIQQSFSVTFDGIKTYDKYDLKRQMVYGTLLTADVIEEAEIEKVLKAVQNNTDLKITWIHEPNRTKHLFTVEEVKRTEEASKITLYWDGENIGVDEKGSMDVEIPALGDFKVIKTTVIQQPDQYVSIMFSDPLLEEQNLEGLITLSSGTSMKFTIVENEIKAYPEARLSGEQTLEVSAGVRNILDYKMKDGYSVNIVFENIKPAIEIIGNGIIIPTTESGMILPFKAVNINAVRVKIVRIYESNVAQFLQINNLDGNSEIKRVGRVVYKGKIPLLSPKPIDYGRWNNFSLDLSKMINADPGAVYKVYLSFQKSESMYPCAGETKEENMTEVEENEDDPDNEDFSYWESYEDYYYYDDYDWQEQDNPCHSTFYYGDRTTVSRNILASDLGIIAKKGTGKSMLFAVTDLKTTEPISGVELQILNFQQQQIATATTDDDGMATVEVSNKPFLLVAKKGTQRGYLKLDDGTSLSLSKFDVSGEIVQKGLKGFIYGERGVWRPGDSLYLTFILEDKTKILPKNHPVSFEFINPQGQTVQNKTLTKGLNGFYNFKTKTEADAPTGNWTAKVKVGGAVFSKTIKIETIKPNRLKVNLDFGVEKLTAQNDGVSGVLEVKWLHGAIAKNLKSTIYATLSAIPTRFEKYADYIFDDPTRDFYFEEKTVFDGKVNEVGKANIYSNLEISENAPGMLKANFDIKVFEESGDFSIDRFSIPYAPYNAFVGIKIPKGDARGMLLTDADHKVEVISVDANGKPIQLKNIKVTFYKVEWRWWWESSEDDLYQYNGNTSYQPLMEKTVSTNSLGQGSFTIKVAYPDWGRYLIKAEDKDGGHSTGQTVYIDWPGWAGRAQRENPGGASMLTFALNKEQYKVGETASITFPSSEGGRALVSIESGSKVIQANWVKSTAKETKYSFTVTKEMAPNAYVNITLVQPHNHTKNNLPIRLYGVMPLKVEDPETHLTPILTMPEVLAPEMPVTLKIKEKDGKKMTFTVAIIDDGLLDLTRFKTPDPWNSFYAREALGVKTWDIYDMVMGAFSGEFAGLLSIGGDMDLMGKKQGNKANRFKPMVKYFGPYQLEANSEKAIKFTMPNYIGSVRTMIVAAQDGAYGTAEKTTPVKKPLMVLATLPRVLGPGEEAKLPVTLFAMDKKIKSVKVTILPNDLLTSLNGKTQQVSFTQEGDKTIFFDLKAVEKLGVGKVKIIAESGTEKATYDLELDIRNPNPRVVNVYDTVIEGGNVADLAYKLAGMKGTNDVVLEVSNIPPLNLGSRLQYLLQYPHGCVEQTTSSVFPQLHLSKLVNDDRLKSKTAENIKAGINRLKSFQNVNGGFSYWPDGGEADDWGSSYAGHFLVEAEKAGYTLPSGMLNLWKKYQKEQANRWRKQSGNDKYAYHRDDFIQAYRLYTLALAGAPELGAMNRLRESSGLSNSAMWQLAASYQFAGKPEVAKELASKATMEVSDDYKELSYSYGSSDRDRAMILEALTLMGMKSKGMNLVKQISKNMSSEYWMSTQTTAYCLLAISKYVGTEAKTELRYTFTEKGASPININTQVPINSNKLKTSTGLVTVRNTGKTMLFARVIASGIPAKGEETSAEKDLQLSVVYKDLEGNTIDPTRIAIGTDFKAEVTVHNPGIRGQYKEMALTQIFPSGWEIRNLRLSDMTSVHYKDYPTYQDIKDDRVYSYFDLNERESKTFVVLLNATFEGKYYLPAVQCEAMYDNTINARERGKWVEVVK